MKFRPILFSTEMVKAILEGRKTMTRRILKLKHMDIAYVGAIHPDGSGKGWIAWAPGKGVTAEYTKQAYPGNQGFACPHGAVGDVLWVRESFCYGSEDCYHGFFYRASDQVDFLEDEDGSIILNKDGSERSPWKPSIHMPKSACRIFLKIEDIRVERLQDISEADAIAEGIQPLLASTAQLIEYGQLYRDYLKKPELFNEGLWPKNSYRSLWIKINGADSWQANPWIWCLSFTRIDKPENFL